MTLYELRDDFFEPEKANILEPVSYRAENLIKSGNQAHIILGNQKYILRITRQKKLILTK